VTPCSLVVTDVSEEQMYPSTRSKGKPAKVISAKQCKIFAKHED
jgi:hypothetical protein